MLGSLIAVSLQWLNQRAAIIIVQLEKGKASKQSGEPKAGLAPYCNS